MIKLKAWADVVKQCSTNLARNWENISEEFGDQKLGKLRHLDYMLAMVYIKGVYQTRYGVLVSELNNDYAKG